MRTPPDGSRSSSFYVKDLPLSSGWSYPTLADARLVDLFGCVREMNQVPALTPGAPWLTSRCSTSVLTLSVHQAIQLARVTVPTGFSQKAAFVRLVNENEKLFSIGCFFITVSSVWALSQEREAWFELSGRIGEEEMIHSLWGKGKLFRQINLNRSPKIPGKPEACARGPLASCQTISYRCRMPRGASGHPSCSVLFCLLSLEIKKKKKLNHKKESIIS